MQQINFTDTLERTAIAAMFSLFKMENKPF